MRTAVGVFGTEEFEKEIQSFSFPVVDMANRIEELIHQLQEVRLSPLSLPSHVSLGT